MPEQSAAENLALVISIICGVAGLIVLFIACWTLPLYRKLKEVHKQIETKEDELDAVESNVTARLTGTLANERYRKKLIEHDRKPLLRDLERLQQKRQFITDKLPFFK